MTVKSENEKKININNVKSVNYELAPPEGGWGYIIAICLSIFFAATITPMTCFGIIFGPFMAKIGDETSGTALANGIFNTVLCFTGLPANHLLQKMSYRKVGFIGAIIYFCGSFTSIFVTSLFQVIISFGVIQGIGFGLMLPAVFTAFNHYFDNRKNVVMSVAQSIIAIITIGFPTLAKFLMDEYGFRGTVAIMSAYSLNCVPAMLYLQPVKWHMRKVNKTIVELKSVATSENNLLQNETKKITIEGKPLLHDAIHRPLAGPVRSLVNMGALGMSVSSIDKMGKVENSEYIGGLWNTISRALDLGLFKDFVYVNIAVGLSLGMTSDLAFIAVLPLLLIKAGLNGDQLTQIMTIYFVSDLACRVSLALLTSLFNIKNRYLFLFGALFSAIFRIAFVLNNSFWFLATISAALGYLRGFIQTTLPLVVAEAYPQRFVTAFSLYMVVCGFIALGTGPLTSVVKSLTNSDIMVVHVLTVLYLLCAIPWLIEVIYLKITQKKF